MKSQIPHYYNAPIEKQKLAREFRKELTFAENRFWQMVRNRKLLNLKIRREHPIGPFIADFYCHELKLVIEIDGGIHLNPLVKERDISREYYMRTLGLSIFRFTNEVVLFNPEIIEERLKVFVDGSA